MARSEIGPRSATRAPLVVVLLAGAWLTVASRLLGYEEASRAVPVEVTAGIALVVLAGVQLIDVPSRSLSRLVVWTGAILVMAPVALRYGYIERIVPAYVNHIAVGLLVLAAGLVTARQATREAAATQVRR